MNIKTNVTSVFTDFLYALITTANMYLSVLSYFPSAQVMASKQTVSLGSMRS
ncbi:hypothetical protein Hanom_Chr02g00168771 [Helianthus anomalus]